MISGEAGHIFRDDRFGFYLANLDGGNVDAPSEIHGNTNAAQADGVLPNGLPVDFAAHVTQMGKLGKVQAQGGVFMDEGGHAISDQLQCRSNPYGEGRWRGISAFTLIGLAATASFARVAGTAVRVQGADATRGPQHAGRNQRGLMHSINCYQWFGHKYPHKMKQGAGLCCEAGAAPGWMFPFAETL
jgi:hypothetical protein